MKSLLSVAVLTAMTSGVQAAGTAAGTDINNTASISYSVGGTAQAAIESSPGGNSVPGAGSATTFKVDKKVDLLVTADAGPFNVSPSAVNQSITYVLTNEGNSTEAFTLTTTGTVALGAGNDFNTTGCSVTSPASPVTLVADGTTAVTVECDIPNSNGGTVSDGKFSLVDLLASANVAAETTGTDTAGTVDIVYADDAGTVTDSPNGVVSGDQTRNAKHSATNTYTILAAKLTISKASAVYSDPFNSTTNPKRIPGAIIRYTITIDNTAGSSDATGLSVSDYIPANMTYADLATLPDPAPAACVADSGGACVLDPALVIGASPAAAGISATGMTVAAGATGTVTFYAKVN